MSLPISAADLLRRFDGPSFHALALMGSHARGDAGPWSDIDLARFLVPGAAPPADDGSHLIDGRLVVVGSMGAEDLEACFTRPERAVESIRGLQTALPLRDDGLFAAVRARAHAFVWDAAMQERADRWASRELVGWIEEARKGLEGLRRGDPGRLLHARHGCTWGLTRVVQVQRGILLAGDNAFYAATAAALGEDSEWIRLRRIAFGIEDPDGRAPTLAEQVRAGLELYCLTADLVSAALQPGEREMVERTVAQIKMINEQ